MPRIKSPPSRWLLPCLVLACLASHAPAHAYDFVLAGNGSGQTLTWYWESAYPAHSCLTNPTPCGNLTSVNGSVSGSYRSFFRPGGFSSVSALVTTSGGSLSWTGNDSLKVVAMTGVASEAFAGFDPLGLPPCWAECWAAVNDRDSPMVFQMIADPGDPLATHLKITPQLVGTFNHTSTIGATTHVEVEMEMAISIDGVQKTSDALHTEWSFDEDADGSHLLEFPKGQLNTVMIPNVSIGSQITVKIWAYARLLSSVSGANGTRGAITATSPYGAGPAIVVVAQPMGIVGVGDPLPPEALLLRARPNPSWGATRIEYALPRPGRVRLAVYDVTGHRVATLAERDESAGDHEVSWNGMNSNGVSLPAGIYLVELIAGRERTVSRLAMLGR